MVMYIEIVECLVVVVQMEFVYDLVGFLVMRCLVFVEYQSFVYFYRIFGLDVFILFCGFLKFCFGCMVGVVVGGVFFVFMVKEVLVVLVYGMVVWNFVYFCNGCYQLVMFNIFFWIIMYMYVFQVGI